MRKYCAIFWVIFLICISSAGCSNKNLENQIKGVIEEQERTVREKELQGYMDTISEFNSEYRAEKTSWFRDIQSHEIEEYHLEVKKIKQLKDETVEAMMKQSYKYQGEEHELEFPLIMIKEKGKWKDNDLKFEEIHTNHFTIKYFPTSKHYAQYIAKACEEAYSKVISAYGSSLEEHTVIKVYRDLEMLRQSVKLSIEWQFAGWYEYPESIKTTEFKDMKNYGRILEHELVHKLTIKKSNNNMPYWFTEGLAVYFTNLHQLKESKDKSYRENKKSKELMDLLEIEKIDLEKLKKDEDISQYYDSAGMIVEFMVKTYGVSKVKDIVDALGEYSYQSGTGSEVDHKGKERFRSVVRKVLDIDISTLNQKYHQYRVEKQL